MTRVRDSGMAEVMLKGINILNPLVDPEAFATFTRYGLRISNYFQNLNSLVKILAKFIQNIEIWRKSQNPLKLKVKLE